MAGDLPMLDLPTDRPRPTQRTFRGAEWAQTLPTELVHALNRLGQGQEATLFMTLLAAFKVLLHRYSGQTDVVVSTLVAERSVRDSEALIGLLLNTLPLRTNLSGSPSFEALLQRVRAVALGAYAHQALPFNQILQVLGVEYDLGHTPLFQTMFILQNAPRAPLDLPGLVLEPLPAHSGVAHYEITLTATEQAAGLHLQWEYNSDLFDEATIARMGGHFRTLLEGIVAAPDKDIARLPLLTRAERARVLHEWNRTEEALSETDSLASLFDAQCSRTPDATAFLAGDQRLSYRELDQRSSRLARFLQRHGVGPEVVVGLHVERSLDMVVALLAIVKAGGAWLPLDPTYPTERLAWMLQDSAAPLVLTQARLQGHLPVGQAQVICLDAEAPSLARESDEPLARSPHPDALAYLIYTSGSSGHPKGVAVPHRQILNRLAWMRRAYPFLPGEVDSQKTALGFVDSIWELFGPLLQGIPTVIVPDDVLRDLHQFVSTLAQHRVSRLWLVPSLLRVLLDTFPDLATRLPSLRMWVTSGEELPAVLFQRFREQMPHATLYNLYGTSEVWDATWYVPEVGDFPARVPIGRPIANVQCYILDEQLEPLPVGVAGELFVGGAGLARGYLRRPALTAEKWVPHPFSQEPGARLYRTGDLARFRTDGQIEFLGRRDRQVQIRGFRVELGEIEARLEAHPTVQQVAVVTRAGPHSTPQLVAYIVPRPRTTVAAAPLREWLARTLPDHMVPDLFVAMDALPMTPSGKLDRRALPALSPTAPLAALPSPAAPQDALEQQLQLIWERVLAIQPIERSDNFFDLGGHSLLAVRLFAEIEKRLGHKLALATLFRAPTIAQLAEAIRGETWGAVWESVVAVNVGGNRTPFFCVPGAAGNILALARLAQHMGSEQPFYAFQDPGLEDEAHSFQQVEGMAAHCLEGLLAVQPEGPYLLGGFSTGGIVAFELAQRLRALGHEVALLALLDTPAHTLPFHGLRHGMRRAGVPWPATLDRVAQRVVPLRVAAFHAWLFLRYDVGSLLARSPVTESRRRAKQLMKVNARATRDYQPQPYDGSITLFKCTRGLMRGEVRADDPLLGWGDVAQGDPHVIELPCKHLEMLHEPHVRQLAAHLRAAVDNVAQPGTVPTRPIAAGVAPAHGGAAHAPREERLAEVARVELENEGTLSCSRASAVPIACCASGGSVAHPTPLASTDAAFPVRASPPHTPTSASSTSARHTNHCRCVISTLSLYSNPSIGRV